MTRCRWTDRIADTVADPAGGVGALTAEEHAHIGRCAECFSTVERLVALDRALTGELRSLERGELPRSVLATPAYERRSRPPVLPVVLGGLAVASAVLVVVVGSGLARNGLSWIGTGTATPMPSISLVPSAEPSVSPSLEPTPGAVPAEAALEIGAIAAVVDEPLVVRTEPGATDASTITDDRLWLGQRVRLLEGPVEADGYPWWRVRVGEIEGWISAEEKDGSAPWISAIANGRIAFGAATSRGPEVRTVEPDGSDEQPLLAQPLEPIAPVISCTFGAFPTWSTDGSVVAWSQQSDCTSEVVVAEADGGAPVRLGPGSQPAISPDGQEVAWGRQICWPDCPATAGPWDILLAPVDGSSPAHPYRSSDDPRFAADAPAWSPDRSAIAFTGYLVAENADGSVTPRVWIADGEGARPITDGHAPVWSPDGRWIVFRDDRNLEGIDDLYRIRPDGSREQRIDAGHSPAFSPDGQLLAFIAATANGEPEVRMVSWPSLEPVATRAPGESVAWSPDGEWLAWSVRAMSDEAAVWISRADGSEPRILTAGSYPAWQPILSGVQQQGG